MRLHGNELCPIHKSHSCCGREFLPKPKLISSEFRGSKIRITREDIGNCGHRPRCENC
jgi:hypothetical protein